MEYTEKNAQTIDRWVNEGWEWGRPIDHEAFLRAKAGEWECAESMVSAASGRSGAGSCVRRRAADARFCRTGRTLYCA